MATHNVRLRIDGNVVKNENYQVLARIDGDQIKDGNHKVIARIDGDQIKDGNYNVIGRLDGKLVKDENYNIVGRLDGNTIKDKNYKVVGRIDGSQGASSSSPFCISSFCDARHVALSDFEKWKLTSVADRGFQARPKCSTARRWEDGKKDELAAESMFITCPFVKREA